MYSVQDTVFSCSAMTFFSVSPPQSTRSPPAGGATSQYGWHWHDRLAFALYAHVDPDGSDLRVAVVALARGLDELDHPLLELAAVADGLVDLPEGAVKVKR